MNEEPVRRINFRAFKVLCREMSTYEDLNTLFNEIVELICRSFEVKACAILLFDERLQELFHVASYGISDTYLEKGPIPIRIEDSALAKGQVVCIEDMSTDKRILYPDAAEQEGFASMICFPISCRKEVIGMIRVYHHEQLRLAEYDLDSFSVLNRLLGLIIEHHGMKNFIEEVKSSFSNLPLRMIKGIES
ncbi:MAG: GAF domain-containing protein [Candidatus Magnetomorum sp.]|nr:GAF domain-containing protein [Candidatus Magnetomorum sp.]